MDILGFYQWNHLKTLIYDNNTNNIIIRRRIYCFYCSYASEQFIRTTAYFHLKRHFFCCSPWIIFSNVSQSILVDGISGLFLRSLPNEILSWILRNIKVFYHFNFHQTLWFLSISLNLYSCNETYTNMLIIRDCWEWTLIISIMHLVSIIFCTTFLSLYEQRIVISKHWISETLDSLLTW